MKKLKEFLMDDTVRLFVIVAFLTGINQFSFDERIGYCGFGIAFLWVGAMIVIGLQEQYDNARHRGPINLEARKSGEKIRKQREKEKQNPPTPIKPINEDDLDFSDVEELTKGKEFFDDKNDDSKFN